MIWKFLIFNSTEGICWGGGKSISQDGGREVGEWVSAGWEGLVGGWGVGREVRLHNLT